VKRAVPYSTVKLVVMRGPAPTEEPSSDESEPPQAPKPPSENKPFQKLEIPVKMGKQ